MDNPDDAKRTQEREAKSDKHDAEDLDAQVRAATAAEDQVWPSWLGAGLAGFGTILLIVNLGIAEVDRRDTKRSNERQLRAYLTVSVDADRPQIVQLHPGPPQEQELHIRVKNDGQTPAYDIRWWVMVEPHAGINEADMMWDRAFSDPQIINPGQEATLTTQSAAWDDAVQRSLPLYVFGRITFKDAFDELRYVRYRRLCPTARDIEMARFVIADRGNDAN